ncbi:MAG: ATP-binding cassette domain-containing protein [Spirochaetales bacterium]
MNFTVTFGYKPKHTIFDNSELEIPEDKITVLCGHNGAGKTTLLKIISGILPSNLKTGQGWYVPANGGLIKHFSLDAHIKILGVQPDDLYLEAFELLGAQEFSSTAIKNLSTGQTAIAAILTALASGENFILLDEPFATLDPVNATNLVTILRKCNKTLLITSHNLFLTTETADKVIFLKKGKVTWQSSEKHSVEELSDFYKDFA